MSDLTNVTVASPTGIVSITQVSSPRSSVEYKITLAIDEDEHAIIVDAAGLRELTASSQRMLARNER